MFLSKDCSISLSGRSWEGGAGSELHNQKAQAQTHTGPRWSLLRQATCRKVQANPSPVPHSAQRHEKERERGRDGHRAREPERAREGRTEQAVSTAFSIREGFQLGIKLGFCGQVFQAREPKLGALRRKGLGPADAKGIASCSSGKAAFLRPCLLKGCNPLLIIRCHYNLLVLCPDGGEKNPTTLAVPTDTQQHWNPTVRAALSTLWPFPESHLSAT